MEEWSFFRCVGVLCSELWEPFKYLVKYNFGHCIDIFKGGFMANKEWNISYCIHDGCGGLDEFLVVLPKFWKVVRWLITRGRECCEIYIWTSHKIANEEGSHG